ncbi:amidohydrolase family protein [Streptomyces adelaidensis]|jgi:L-fuconolactonase|uniref:amidohydrolase family protein n=1 Tax=Streptomyces adelaidensis TaxID=2796465 RepID=UPI001904A258|nr:amidohydrolase family protein [Streptomyces adelaidensis]
MTAPTIDAHVHVWNLRHRDQPWIDAGRGAIRRDFSLDDFTAATRDTGVRRAVLVQVLNMAEETREHLLRAQHDDRVAGVVGWVDLAAPAVAEQLAGLRACPGGESLAGIRHQALAEDEPAGWLEQPAVQSGLRELAGQNLPYDLMFLPEHMEAVTRTVRTHEDLTFVLDHLGKPPIATGALAPWAAGVRELGRSPNVVCKLSGMVTTAARSGWTTGDLRPYAETAIEVFGPERLMFGSDWPVSLLAAAYPEVVRTCAELVAELSPDEQALIFSTTATRVYGLMTST